MIYVTVGSSIGGAEFDRLVKKVDDIAPSFEEEFVVQLGASKYIPRNVEWFDYVSYEESLEYFRKARLVIGHCGSGTIINALSFGKPLIVMPRLVKFNENTNDHQLEMAKLLENIHLARVVYDVEGLEIVIRNTLEELRDSERGFPTLHRRNLINGMRDFLKGLNG
ncbi:MAG TPA: glycosyltransferase [Thermodesulfobacteriota bacterium]|nr:glycosyltransferase [Thermodesulfobacteriota bacterium]